MKYLLIVNSFGVLTQALDGLNEVLTSIAVGVQAVVSIYVVIKEARKK